MGPREHRAGTVGTPWARTASAGDADKVEEFWPRVDRAGSTFDGPWVIYRPVVGGRFATLRLVAVQGHAYSRWHIAFCAVTERWHYTQQVNGLGKSSGSPKA
jgi:hypothetical protein